MSAPPRSRPRVAVLHPRLGRGGSEAVAMWALAALQDDYALTLLTTGDVDWDALNAFCGTAVRGAEVAISRPALPPGALRGVSVGVALRRALSQRHARRVAGRFDVLVSAYNPVDFGRRAIQIIGDLSFDPTLARRFDPLPPGLRGRFQASRLPRAAYRWLASRIARPSGRDVLRDDRVLANSRWVAGVMEGAYGVHPEVLYPPVPDAPTPRGEAWERRAERFVAIGRFAPEKRLERLIGIVAGLRGRGHDVTLHLAGDPRGAYGERIAAQARAAGDWVVLTGPVHGEAKARLLGGSRYALHGREGEPFGIAVAEVLRAGCVPFVPALGGPAEIVDDPALTWIDEAQAVDRIDRLLRDAEALRRARERLAERGPRFGTAAFVAGVRRAVGEELARVRGGAAVERDG